MALNMLNKKVDSVFEKTTKDNTRFKAVEPILETIVPRVIVVKFFVLYDINQYLSVFQQIL